jgi:hypothetical protein
MPNKIIPIYPTGRGHYALGSPDGAELRAGLPINVLLAGQQLSGQVKWSGAGDYIQFSDQSFCGLYPAMQVVTPSTRALEIRRRRGPYRSRGYWTPERQQHLAERYIQLALASPQRSLRAIGCQIAEEISGDRAQVCAKLYQLRFSLGEELRHRQELRACQAINQPLVRLLPGNMLWIVRQATEMVAWFLAYPHGACPVAPGQLCLYNRVLYRASLVGFSHFSVVKVSPYTQEGVSHALV